MYPGSPIVPFWSRLEVTIGLLKSLSVSVEFPGDLPVAPCGPALFTRLKSSRLILTSTEIEKSSINLQKKNSFNYFLIGNEVVSTNAQLCYISIELRMPIYK